MSSREIAELTEKNHADVLRDIRSMLEQLGLGDSSFAGTYLTAQNKAMPLFNLPHRETMILMTGYSVPMRAKVVDRWQELESQAPKPAELSRMDVLKLAIESEEARLKAEAERDKAIATKAQIGSKREASAMAKASVAVREANKLRDQLGFNTRHATILAVESKTGQEYAFLPLRRWCAANEVTPETVPDKRYPAGVKAWPAAAWLACFGVDLADLFAIDAAMA